MDSEERPGKGFDRLVSIMAHLRSAQGCPWDREQDEKTISNYFLEEVYETMDAVMADDARRLEEELGDVLMEVVFLVQIYQEKGHFSMASVLDGIIRKMIRRHPHVFARKGPISSREVAKNWQEHKNAEKKRRTIFEGMSNAAPALLQAFQAGQRASARGFDRGSAGDVLEKVKEELRKVEAALGDHPAKKVRDQIGALLFSVASLSRLAGHNPEIALRAATRKFQRRFKKCGL